MPTSSRSQSSRSEPPLSGGLVFFSPKDPATHRRRRWIFVALGLLATAMLIWPLGLVGARAFPLVFGLPFSLAWVVLALLILFFSLIWLFLNEGPENGTNTED